MTQIESLARWSKPREVSTKFGPRILRKAVPTEDFSAAWKSNGAELKAAGVSWSKTQDGEWEICWWQKLDAAVVEQRQAAIAASRATDAQIEVPTPPGLSFMPFQRAGLAYALQRQRTLFAQEMGLGKTPMSVGVINATPEIARVLIICPASLKVNWSNEIKRWSTRPVRTCIADGKSCPVFTPVAGQVEVLIVNYDILAKHAQKLRSVEWDLMVADEIHYAKSAKAIRTRQLLGGDGYHGNETPIPAKRMLGLTGTPMLNKPVEMWTILHAMAPEEFPSFFSFAKRYCAANKTRWGWDFSGSSNLEELQEKARRSCMIRVLKKDVLTELPPKRRQVIELPANGCAGLVENEEREYRGHEDTLESLRAAVEISKASEDPADYEAAVNKLRSAAQVAFTRMAKVRHEVALAKVSACALYLRDALENCDRAIVFAHHLDVIEKLRAEFSEDALVITGETPPEKRQGIVDQFNAGGAKLLLLGIHAAGQGLSVKASLAVFCELDWVPAILTQCEDRAHGLGRGIEGEPLLVVHLVLEGSLDARMARMLVEKQAIADAALDKITATKDEPMLFPQRDQASTETMSRRALDEVAAKITDDQSAAVHEALRMLAGMCDGARQLDGCGFNKIDSAIGKSLASAPMLTCRQAALGLKIALKYRRQLDDELMERMKGKT